MDNLIKEFVENLINPQKKEQKKFSIHQELSQKFNKSLYLKEYLKSKAWQEFEKPLIYRSLEQGISLLLREGLTMNETDIKAQIASMRVSLNKIVEMRHAIESGEEAGSKLEKVKP